MSVWITFRTFYVVKPGEPKKNRGLPNCDFRGGEAKSRIFSIVCNVEVTSMDSIKQ